MIMRSQLKFIWGLGIFLWSAATLQAQELKTAKGKVFIEVEVENDHGALEKHWDPLPGAFVVWTSTGQGAATDASGFFKLKGVVGDTLQISFIGMQTTQMPFIGQKFIEIPMAEGLQLNAAEVVVRGQTSSYSMLDPLNVQTLDRGELAKAACCNISEAFETNAAVDASFTDAITGTRQIRMLGLDGKYTQIMKDNMPGPRGLAVLQGLTFIPGPWVQAIQISKGAGSVTLGHESMTGQINVQMRNPENAERFHLNGFVNKMGRYELNTVTRHAISRKWNGALLTHGEWTDRENDKNGDGFQDNALRKDVVLRGELKYRGDRGIRGEYTLSGVIKELTSGQVPSGFDVQPIWAAQQDVRRLEASAKTGYVFPKTPWRSFGSQLYASSHNQRQVYGPRTYDAQEDFARFNLLYSTIIGSTDHKITFGMTGKAASYCENIWMTDFSATDSSDLPSPFLASKRLDRTVGAYAEYTWSRDLWDVVAGVRVDEHAEFGTFFSPRFNARYTAADWLTFKLASGKGWRTSTPLAEFAGPWASSRTWVFPTATLDSDYYGLRPEQSWNTGLNVISKFRLGYRDAGFSLDAYRVDFTDRVILDLENPREAHVYNAESSVSTSAQVEFWWDIHRRLSIRMAYRMIETETAFEDGMLSDPFVSKHRGFANFAYASRVAEDGSGWKADLTVQWVGEQRLPSTYANPMEYQRPDVGEAYWLASGQVTKMFSKAFDVYVGSENLTGYRQDRPIIAEEDPFGDYFDASLVYAPVFGRNLYAGLRWTLDN